MRSGQLPTQAPRVARDVHAGHAWWIAPLVHVVRAAASPVGCCIAAAPVIASRPSSRRGSLTAAREALATSTSTAASATPRDGPAILRSPAPEQLTASATSGPTTYAAGAHGGCDAGSDDDGEAVDRTEFLARVAAAKHAREVAKAAAAEAEALAAANAVLAEAAAAVAAATTHDTDPVAVVVTVSGTMH
jgi:hypothetical protein